MLVKLKQFKTIPPRLLTIKTAAELYKISEEPFLLHLEGHRKAPLFSSVLLHGNEDTGFLAVQQLLRKYQKHPLPRSFSIFFGNIEAAKQNVRRLEGQPDYNRVWPGTDYPDCKEVRLMALVTEIMAARQPFASIDVHNNTGCNPHYACVNRLSDTFLQLATLFSRTVVFFQSPRGVQSMAMAQYCPSVTVECGKPHLPHGVKQASRYLEAALHLSEIPQHPVHEVDLFHTVARITIPKQTSFSFRQKAVDIHLPPALDYFNFSEMPIGTLFAHVDPKEPHCFQAWDDQNQDKASLYFSHKNGQLRLKQAMMPAMLTLDEKMIRQDCLCYLMKRLAYKTSNWFKTSL